MFRVANALRVAVCYAVVGIIAIGFLHKGLFFNTPDWNWKPTWATERPNDSEIEDMFKSRRETAFRACRKLFGYDPAIAAANDDSRIPAKEKNFFIYTHYDDRYKFLFCRDSQAANKRIIAGSKTFHHLPRTEIAKRMNYGKIIVVRHPLDRLLSMWRNKFSNKWPNPEFTNISAMGHQIVSKYRNISERKIHPIESVPPTLTEFFTFLSKDGGTFPTHPETANDHWSSYVRNCDVCRVDYDYIVHFENLKQELGYVMKAVTGIDVIEANLLAEPAGTSFAAEVANSTSISAKNSETNKNTMTLQSVFGKQLPPDLVRKVVERYAADFEIFGYSKSDLEILR